MSRAGEREWMVTVETMPGFTRSPDVLERVARAVESDDRALGPALSLDRETGVLSATFHVRAHAGGAAVHTAIDAFYAALGVAGYDVERPGWRLAIEFEPAEAEALPA
jgi:hypothetical protein